MSLRIALNAKKQVDYVKVQGNIISLCTPEDNIIYACMLQDIEARHPTMGTGNIISVDKNNRWLIDFANASELQEYKLKEILQYLHNKNV